MTAPHPRTIQIYLPLGDPRSLRVAELTTRIVRVFEVPRPQLDEFFKRPEADQVGIYYLVGQPDDPDSLPQLYIGQTGDLKARLKEHNKNKDFWQRAYVVVATNSILTQTHALYLEALAIQAAKEVGRYKLENGNDGSPPYIPDPLKADCDEIHDTAATLLATLGQPVFEALVQKTAAGASQPGSQIELFFLKDTKGEYDARGGLTDEGFVVLKDSRARVAQAPSFTGSSAEQVRKNLIQDGTLVPEESGGSYRFTRDYLFRSPSGAADAVAGRSTNGWDEWKNADGDPLNIKRQTS